MIVKIHRSIAEVDPARWNAVVGRDQIFCTHEYVETLEKSNIGKGSCYYPVVYDGDEIISHTCVYLANTELDLLAQGALKKTIGLIRQTWKDFLVLRYLECGSPAAVGNPVSLKEGADHIRALRLLCRGIEGIAKELGVKLIVSRDFYDKDTKFHNIFEEHGYMKIHNLPKAEMKVRWKSFDEYLNSMRSGYRCKIIKNMERCSAAKVSIQVLKNSSGHYAHELKRLHDNVSNQAKEIRREPLPEAFFQNIDKYLGERSVMLLALKDSKPIGFMFLFLNGKELVPSIVGLDYDYSQQCCTYFNLFYATIRFAIETGMDKIDMGITTLNPKKDMGSDVVTLNMFMKHSNPILNRILPTLFDMITPPDTTGPRNVFKESPTGM